MQILHVSDTHLGCIQFNLKEREDDVYEAFNEAIDAAVKDRVDAVIHAGDIFHTPKPSGTAMLKLGEALKRLNEHGIRFFFTLGEHDISRVRDTPSPYVFHKLGMATYVGDGKPYIYKDILLIGFHKHKRSESDDLKKKLKSINLADAKRRVLLLHQGLGEFHPYANELSMNDLPLGFNYYAMGHLHDHAMKPYGDGIICYPGSIDPTPGEGIKELKKGFCIVDLSGSEARVDFIQVRSSRRHMEYVVEYERLGDLIKKVMDDAKGLKKKPLVAVRIKGSKGIDSARIASILSRLNDICLHYTWEVESTSKASAGRLYDTKPDIDRELLELAKGALTNEDYANLAINELLPLLNDDDVDGAIDLIWKRFEESRSAMSK